MTPTDDLTPEQRANFDEYERESKASAEKWIERMGLEGEDAQAFRDHTSKWILVGDEPVRATLLEWAEWSERYPDQKIINRDEVTSPGGRIFRVSTVFLGLDHRFGMSGPPILFETMIFDDVRINRRLDRWRDRVERGLTAQEQMDEAADEHDPEAPEATIRYDGWQMRYPSAAEARAGHKLTVQMVANGLDDWTENE